MTPSNPPILLLLLLAACDESPRQFAHVEQGECPRFLSCRDDLGTATHTLHATYGPAGSCWTTDPRANELCRAACADGLDEVWAEASAPAPPPACFETEAICESADFEAVSFTHGFESGLGITDARVKLQSPVFDGQSMFLHFVEGENTTFEVRGLPGPGCVAGACAWYGRRCPEGNALDVTACERQFQAIWGEMSVSYEVVVDRIAADGTLTDVIFAELGEAGVVESSSELRCYSLEWSALGPQ